MTPSPSSPELAVVFFGYWSGSLPRVSELHFRSFLHHHPRSTYELWLDEDDASAITAPELQWMTRHPRIVVRPFSLNRLIEKHVTPRPVHTYGRWRPLRRLAQALHRKLAPRAGHGRAWAHPLFGLTYRHSSALFEGFTHNKTYRGDLARFLLPLEHYRQPCLYVDLDLCFTSDLLARCQDTSFVYRWEEFGFANNAVVYMPDARCSAALVRQAIALECFRPWILLTDAICRELRIDVLPAPLFDPLWDPHSLLQGDTSKFFSPRHNLERDLQTLQQEHHLAIHWHNNWKTVPAPTSIYAGLLRACQ